MSVTANAASDAITKPCVECNREVPLEKFLAGGRVKKCLDCIIEASKRDRAAREARKARRANPKLRTKAAKRGR